MTGLSVFQRPACSAPAFPAVARMLVVTATVFSIWSPRASNALSQPSISAAPQRVAVGDRPGTTRISWDTGDGSTGFVFVTANGKDPVLFASGPKGSSAAPWIGRGRYVFELWRDTARRELLAAVEVSGTAPPAAVSSAMFSQRAARWFLVAALAVVLYVALYLSSPGPVRTKFPAEPATSPRPLHVARNFLLGALSFVVLDGAIFHTGLYSAILAPDSYAGRVSLFTRKERERPPSGLKEILILGDSRMAEGFSARVADQLGGAAGLKFVNLADPASTANIWHYMLREVDPAARRYWAIVIPYGGGYEPDWAESLRISMAAPLLRYRDCFEFAGGFRRWPDRFKAFTACILRGTAYQNDVVDLLQHPFERIRRVREVPQLLEAHAKYEGRDENVATSDDTRRRQSVFAPTPDGDQGQTPKTGVTRMTQPEIDYFLKLQKDWIGRILERYLGSSTAIVLTPVPRSPSGGMLGVAASYQSELPSFPRGKTAFLVPPRTFDFLEKPEYYFDNYHLNAKGRQLFTERLVAELLGWMRSAAARDSSGADATLLMGKAP